MALYRPTSGAGTATNIANAYDTNLTTYSSDSKTGRGVNGSTTYSFPSVTIPAGNNLAVSAVFTGECQDTMVLCSIRINFPTSGGTMPVRSTPDWGRKITFTMPASVVAGVNLNQLTVDVIVNGGNTTSFVNIYDITAEFYANTAPRIDNRVPGSVGGEAIYASNMLDIPACWNEKIPTAGTPAQYTYNGTTGFYTFQGA